MRCCMKEDINYAKAYLDFMKDLPEDNEWTWDDFFEIIGVKKELRSDFLIACILKQAREFLSEEERSALVSGE